VRRFLAVLALLALMIPAVGAGAPETENYRDDFGSGGYTGNDGSLDFSGPWAEFGDPVSGPDGGNVHIGPEYCSNNECVHIEGGEGLDPGLVLTSFGLSRTADLSVFSSAELCFDIQIIPQTGMLETTNAELWVQVHDGTRWHTIKEYDLSQATEQHKTLDVTEYMSSSFRVRFKVPNAVEAGLTGLELFYNGYTTIDRVEITGTLTPPSTTSTSTTSTSTPATTSTTKPKTNATTSSTSTTAAGATATTRPGSANPTPSGPGDTGTTSTTIDSTTTSTTPESGLIVPGRPPGPPSDSGLRDPGMGLMADYSSGMMGDMDMGEVEVLGAELTADFSLAVEAFQAVKIWIAALALLIGAALVSGLDSRRWRRQVSNLKPTSRD
jgi:hypothetical protein